MTRAAGLMSLVLVASLTQRSRAAQAVDSAPPLRMAARQGYRDAKFGMFIHWGVYSLLGQGEWVMQNREIPVGAYEWLASTFDPVKFDARAWVSLAKAAREPRDEHWRSWKPSCAIPSPASASRSR